MKTIPNILAGCVAAAALMSSAVAHEILFEFTIDGGQEVPPNNSPGTGFGTLLLDTHSNDISWDITFSGLLGDVTGAHFHGPAEPGQNAGILIDIGAISGLESPMIGSTEINEAQKASLLAGLWYVNIHTTEFSGGEIRGQVVEPPPSLHVEGECPGRVTLHSSGNTPGERVAFAYAFGTGNFVIPSGPCAGTELGLNASVTMLGIVNANNKGDAQFSGNAPQAACGRVFLQSVDVVTCSPSTVESL